MCTYVLQVEGYTAVANVRGVTFLDILGVNVSAMTHYIIILDCMYAIFIIMGLIFIYLRIYGKRDCFFSRRFCLFPASRTL